MIGATQPVFVIVDGHPIHKSKLVPDYVATLEGRLKLFRTAAKYRQLDNFRHLSDKNCHTEREKSTKNGVSTLFC